MVRVFIFLLCGVRHVIPGGRRDPATVSTTATQFPLTEEAGSLLAGSWMCQDEADYFEALNRAG